MTTPGAPPPPDGPPDEAIALEDLAIVTGALERGGPARFAALVRALRHAIWFVCALAAVTGLSVIAFGAIAARGDPGSMVVLVLIGGPPVVLAFLIGRHTGALARAVARPADTVDQAKDLVLRAKGSPELHRLARTIVARKATRRGGGGGTGVGRLRRAVRSGRTISAVIGLAQPDHVRHDLLVPFTPMRLKRLWLEITIGLWWWLVAAIVAMVAFFAALLSLL